MRNHRDPQRARRSTDGLRVEGLEIRLALSGTPTTGIDLSNWFEPFGDPSSDELDVPGDGGDLWGGPFSPIGGLIPPPPLIAPEDWGDGAIPIEESDPLFPDPGTEGPSVPWQPAPPGSVVPWPGPSNPGAPGGGQPAPAPDPLPLPMPPVPGLPGDNAPAKPPVRIVSVDPADGARLNAGQLRSLTVRFSVPLRAEMLVPSDFILERVRADGSVQQVFGPGRPAAVSLSGDGSRLEIRPERPIEPGQYRLKLSGNARFVSEAGSILDGDGTDRILSEFRVVAAPAAARPPIPKVEEPAAPAGVRLRDATALGTIGPQVLRVAGSLDLRGNPAAVDLYRIELAPGHFWRLGLEISAGRDGSALLGRISVFDANGRLLRTGEVGMADAPSDPFLFLGLKPGTYYVGVSAAGNRPLAGGYDPVTGAVPVNLPSQPGGSYSLALVADVADAPARLVGFGVNRADPADPVPTGLTLHFDSPLILNEGHASDADLPESPIVLVDASGKVWRTGLVATDGTGSSLTLLFYDRLPRGRYEIRLGASGALTDLVGRDPVAEGQAAGSLGWFEVTTEPTGRRPNDLGALLPAEALGSVNHPLTILPGSSTAVRFVVTFEAMYLLRIDGPDVAMTFELIGPDGAVDLGNAPQSLNGMFLELRPGEYLLRVVNPNGHPIDARFELEYSMGLLDSVPLNGVGQGPALGMRLASSAAGLPPRSYDPIASQVALGMGEATVSPVYQNPSGAVSAGSGLLASPHSTTMVGVGMPVGPMLTPEMGLIGFPEGEGLRVVGLSPGQDRALASTASIAEGSQLAQVVPIGFGQSADRPEVGARRAGGPVAGPGDRDRIDAATDRGGDVVRRGDQAPELARSASPEAVDEVLALLARDRPRMTDGASDLQGNIGPQGPVLSLDELDSRRQGDADDERVEHSLIRALGVGVVVGWTARYWSRRRRDEGRVQDRAGLPVPGVRADLLDGPGARQERAGRRPGSPAST